VRYGAGEIAGAERMEKQRTGKGKGIEKRKKGRRRGRERGRERMQKSI
jgi:hypothetical protein